MRKTIHLMGVFVLIFSLFISLFPAVSFGEILTIKHTVKQTFGGGQSPDDARISAMSKAKREALEKAGTYIESLTIVQNSKVEKDEILALTAGVLKAEVISQDNFATKDAFGIEIIVNVVVDTSVLEERVKKQLQDRTHLTQLKDTQKREKELLQKVAQLEEENRKLSAQKQSTDKIKKEFQQASRGLTAVDWFYKADALLDMGKYTDPKKAIIYLSNGLKLQPNLADAYYSRGNAYDDLVQYQRAIEDYNEAIRLKPNYASAYNNRGIAYKKLAQHQRAIDDYNEAIRLKPDLADAYGNRGNAYDALGQHQRAIDDYNKVISLKPDDALGYSNRGVSYYNLGLHQRAIDDFNEAIRLEPDDADTYENRGIAYKNLGQYLRAIDDYNKAIRLKPNYATSYVNRGYAYSNLGQYQRAIEDYNKAIRLKPDYVKALVNRGCNYNNLAQYKRAIEDFNKAIRLQPDLAEAYYFRGVAYCEVLGQHKRAIEDFNQAIRLKPEYADAYNWRGITHFYSGNNNFGCRDALKACEYGNCKLLEMAKSKGNCH